MADTGSKEKPLSCKASKRSVTAPRPAAESQPMLSPASCSRPPDRWGGMQGPTAASQLQRQTPHSPAFRQGRACGAATVHWGAEALRRAQLPVPPRALPGRTQLVWAKIQSWGYAHFLPSAISLAPSAEEAPHCPQLCHSLVTGQERCHAVFAGTESSAKADALHASCARLPDSCQGLPVAHCCSGTCYKCLLTWSKAKCSSRLAPRKM